MPKTNERTQQHYNFTQVKLCQNSHFHVAPEAYKKVYFDIIKLEMYKIVLHNLIILNSFSSDLAEPESLLRIHVNTQATRHRRRGAAERLYVLAGTIIETVGNGDWMTNRYIFQCRYLVLCEKFENS